MSFHRKSLEAKQKTNDTQLYKNITIYGSYYPLRERRRLYKLKKCIRKRSFKNTHLARDYHPSHFPFKLPSNINIRNLFRSRYCLKSSDLNILIFTFEGEKTGVGYELEFAIRKRINFLLFRESKIEGGKEILAGSSLIDGLLLEISTSHIDFPIGDDDSLCDAVYHRIIDFFIQD